MINRAAYLGEETEVVFSPALRRKGNFIAVSVEGAVICFVVVRSYGDRSPCIAAEINIGTKLCIQTVSSVVYRIGEPCKLCRRADQIGILFRTGAGGLNL